MDGFLIAATFFIVAATLLPCLRLKAWWIRDFDFPRLQLTALAGLLLAVEVWWLWRTDSNEAVAWVMLAATVAVLLYQSWWILPYSPFYPCEVKSNTKADAPTLRILSANVLMDNRDASRVCALVTQSRPDIFVALETDLWWEDQLDCLRDHLPHVLRCPLDNRYGMHVYSRLPLLDARIQFLMSDGVPSMHFGVALEGGDAVAIHCIHPTPPSPTENDSSSERDAELVMVGRAVANRPEPVVVAGDLNDVAWSRTTRLFRKVSGLLDPRVGRGMFNTFHAGHHLLRWPLDHLFHSDHFTLVSMRRLGPTGSDHFPILVELALTPMRQPSEGGLEADADDEEAATETLRDEGVSPAVVHRPNLRTARQSEAER